MNYQHPHDPEKTVLLIVAVVLVLFWLFRHRLTEKEMAVALGVFAALTFVAGVVLLYRAFP